MFVIPLLENKLFNMVLRVYKILPFKASLPLDAVTAMLHLLLAEVQSFKYTAIMSNVCFKLFSKHAAEGHAYKC